MKTLKNKKILIGITGGIATYKVCSIINHLRKEEAEVKVILTKSASKFINPITFESLSGSFVYTDEFIPQERGGVEHIELAKWADVMLIAPATANTIGKISSGIADNLLTTVVMATEIDIPVVICPTMNTKMWENPIVQKNITFLKNIKSKNKEKYFFIEPVKGELVCGDVGIGKMAKNEDIVDFIKNIK